MESRALSRLRADYIRAALAQIGAMPCDNFGDKPSLSLALHLAKDSAPDLRLAYLAACFRLERLERAWPEYQAMRAEGLAVWQIALLRALYR